MDIRAIRRSRLDELVAEAKTVADLSRRTGVSEKYLRQIINGYRTSEGLKHRSIGHSVARRLESGMNKPPGWMDRAAGSPVAGLSEQAFYVAQIWENIPEDLRPNLLAILEFSASAAKMLGKSPQREPDR